MAFWQHSPADVDDRLVELAHLFVDCRAAFFETADRFHWSPELGSVAARAAAELPSPDPAIADPRGETGHRLIAEVAQTYLLTASGHLGGLASLYASGEVFFPPAALIRATIENCAHAMWVLGDDPTEPSENRLARAYLEELLSAEQAKMNAGRLGAKSGPIHMQANDDYKTLKRQILARFPSADTATLGKWTLQDQTLLGPEATVAWMYALAQKAGGSSVGDRAALGIYGFLSNMTHPTLYPARQLRAWTDDPAAGHPVAYLKLDLDFLERQASAAVMAFYNALSYVTSYFGWPRSVHDDLTEKIDRAMPTFFS
ncbi:hypothetical protein JCM18899A_47750 [Nocardioides sp. AN3]